MQMISLLFPLKITVSNGLFVSYLRAIVSRSMNYFNLIPVLMFLLLSRFVVLRAVEKLIAYLLLL